MLQHAVRPEFFLLNIHDRCHCDHLHMGSKLLEQPYKGY